MPFRLLQPFKKPKLEPVLDDYRPRDPQYEPPPPEKPETGLERRLRWGPGDIE